MAKTQTDAIDPASDEPVIYFAGDKAVAGVPARDLSGGDLSRIAYVRAHHGTDWSVEGSELPKAATAHQLAKLADELVESGAYRRTKPDVPRETDDTTTEEPAAPAETTEG